MKFGVLALQGDFAEHIHILSKLGINAREIKTKEDLHGIKGLIIPGGESTTIIKLMKNKGLDKEILHKAKSGMVIYGTCAGMIVLAKEINGNELKGLGLIDITVKRNDYGRQIESFETDIGIKGFGKPFHAIFIRAPVIKSYSNKVEVLAVHKNEVVLARHGNILVSSFHPELTSDTRVHELFASMIH